MPAVSQVLTGSRTVVAGDGLTIDITISSVDVSRSVVMHTVRSEDVQGRLQRYTFAAHLVNATTLRLQRYESSYAVNAYVEWTVVEFESGALANLQTGLVTPTSNTTDTAITPVDTGAAFPIVTRYVEGMYPGIISQQNLPSFVQTSVPGDTFRLKWNGTNYTPGSGYRFQIVEFDPADAAVQSGTIVGAGSSYSGTATISAVDLDATLLAFFGTCGGDAQRGYTLFKLNSATQVYAGRQELGSATAFTVGWFAVEMLDGSLVEEGALSIADGSTTPASQPSWTPALTDGAVFQPCSMPNARIVAASDVGGPKDVQHTVKLDAGQASATVQRYGSVAQVDLYWQVVDWKTSGGAVHELAGDATAGASVAGDLTTGIQLDGDASAAATASGDLTTGIPLAGDADASAQASGTLSSEIRLAAAALVSATATGSLSTVINLAGSAAFAALADGTLTTQIRLAGDAIAGAVADAGLSTQILLDADAQAGANASGELTTVPSGLAGDAVAGATASGALSVQIILAGDALASVLASGDLTTAGAGAELAADATVLAIASGGLTTAIQLTGAPVISVTASGELSIGLGMTAEALATVSAAAVLSTQIRMEGAAVVSALAAGSLSIGTAEHGARRASWRGAARQGWTRPASVQRASRPRQYG